MREGTNGRRPLAGLLLPALLLAGGGCNRAPAPEALTPDDSPALLTEITNEVGLASPAADWPDGTFFLPEIMGPGLALFDADGDGDLDLLQLRVPTPGDPTAPAPNRLYRHEDDGTFHDVSAASGLDDPGFGQGVAVGDMDNDGDADVYLANYGNDRLFRNNGDGTFDDATAAAGIADDQWSSAATFCDVDGDGWLDLYVVHYLNVDYDGPCRTNSGEPDYCGPASFDGRADRLWRNNGDGSFNDVTAAAGLTPAEGGRKAKGLGVVCTDLTGDGRADFYVANDGEANQLWVGRGDGTFADEAIMRGVAVNRHGRAEASMGLAVGDVDGDGKPDLLSTHLALENNTIYLGGDLLFSDRTVESGMSERDLPLTGFGCGFFDLEHDGDLDLAVVNGEVRGIVIEPGERATGFWERYAEPNLLFLNDGRGRFQDVSGRAGTFGARLEVSRGLAFGDLDDDGDLDLALSNVDNTLRIHRNDAPREGSHWLRVRALAHGRDALGARVTVVSGSRRHVAAVLPGASYQSSSDPRVHFGLGAGSIDTIEVRWANGRQERFAATGVDREITLVQGRGEPR